MENREIAAAFDKLGELLEFQGANPFRVRAYRNAARRLRDLGEPLAEMVERGDDVRQIDGIGEDLALKIHTLLTTGKLPQLEELEAQIPRGVLALMRVPGMGPKKAAMLHEQLGIESLEDLRQACLDHRVRGLKGFGAKTEEALLAGIDLASKATERMRWADADEVVHSLVAHLGELPAVRQISPAGSYRRGRDTVGDIDLLVDADDAAAVMDRLAEYDALAEILARGDTKMSVRLDNGLQVDLRVVPTESYGAALQYFTGSKDHNVELRGKAKEQGLKVSEWGVFRVEKDGTETYLAGKTEEEVYAALDLPCFPPELRENRGEFAYHRAEDLPRLVELSDLVADLHMHTTHTDGKNTLEEMVAEAQTRGFRYIAITDHSKRVSMARGLDADRLRGEWKEIDRLNERLEGFRILKGIECDILERGGMDLDDQVLLEADWVIASLHYGQKQSREQITDRILGALANPWVSMLAHPTGRLINRREAYAVDMEAVFQGAAEHGKLLELNANPARLDLDDVYCARARQLGIPIVVNSDAHSTQGMNVLRYGILQARRAGLTAADVANTRGWEELSAMIRRGE